MRPEKLYLFDILEAAEAIERFCEAVGQEEFLHDEIRQSAVLQKFIVIGEAAARLTVEFRNQHPEIEWESIIGFRNIAVHEYFAILWQIVWNTATIDIPDLRQKIQLILEESFPEK